MRSSSRCLHLALAGVLGAVVAAPLLGAGGTPAPQVVSGERAAESYRRGARYREQAVAYEERAAAATGEEREAALAKARKEYERAQRALRSAVEDDPSLYQAHSDLGFVLRKLGDLEASLAAYERALDLAPEYGPAIEYRAEAHLGLGRLEEAKDAYLELFRRERALADRLLAAMGRWVEERRGDPAGHDLAVVEEFARWIAEREALAGQAADLVPGAAPSW